MKPTEPNDATMLKITPREKEFLLSQIQIIFLQIYRLKPILDMSSPSQSEPGAKLQNLKCRQLV